jgi:TonB family protein
MIVLIYLLKTVLISAVLIGYYWIFLRNRIFHGFNRYVLLSVPVISLLLPVFHFNLPVLWSRAGSASPIRLWGVGQGKLEEAVTVFASHHADSRLPWELTLAVFSVGISFILLFRLLRSIRFLWLLQKESQSLRLADAIVFFVDEKEAPFSFFKSIFWRREMDINSSAGKQILRHELFHVRHHHSMDILLTEIMSLLFWFNPCMYILRRELQTIHEYAADADASKESGKYEYASLLLTKATGSALYLTNPFLKSQIKKRITMISNSGKSKTNTLGRLMVLPLILALTCLFSFRLQNHYSIFTPARIRVVIDAGHGGAYSGSQSAGVYEKNINLSIAKKIQALSNSYQVDVIMTRENDEDIAGNDLDASLKYRAGLAEKKNADLFISIHINATKESTAQHLYSGFEIYVPDSSHKSFVKSVQLASGIAEFIKPDYSIEPELKQRKGNIRVLDDATVPAILIECGYMDNPSDLKYLTDEMNQEKIARDILEGIRKYSRQMNNPISFNKSMGEETAGARSGEISVPMKRDTNIIYTKVDIEADYPGGPQAWIHYLQKNLKYPQRAVMNEIQGEVMMEFVVKKNGKLTNIHAVSGPAELKEASINIIKGSGKWIPAKQHGEVVESYHRQPIIFKLQEG